MICFSCSRCSHELKINEKMAGRKGKCPYCGQPIEVPAAKALEVPAAVWSEATIPSPSTPEPMPAIPVATAPPQPLPQALPADLATVVPHGDTPGPEGSAGVDPENYAFLRLPEGRANLAGWDRTAS